MSETANQEPLHQSPRERIDKGATFSTDPVAVRLEDRLTREGMPAELPPTVAFTPAYSQAAARLREGGEEPTYDEVIQEMSIPQTKEDIIKKIGQILDSPEDGESISTASPNAPEETVLTEESRRKIMEAIDSLDYPELSVLFRHLGIDTDAENLAAMARTDGKSRGEVKAIYDRALRLLRDRLGDVQDVDVEGVDLSTSPDSYDIIENAKKRENTRRLTIIDSKMRAGKALGREELLFLYELHGQVNYFPLEEGPNLYDLREGRNPEEDMPVIFSCEPSQIARSMSEIRPDTKAYVGPLVPGIFIKLAELSIEHVYTSFPEGRIQKQSIEVGGKSKTELKDNLQQAHVTISYSADRFMNSSAFDTLPTAQTVETVWLTAQQIGFSTRQTIDKIYERAQELGLELCPSEILPQFKIQHRDLPHDEFFVSVKPKTGSTDAPTIFRQRYDVPNQLEMKTEDPNMHLSPAYKFAFCLPKPEDQHV